MKTAGKLQQFFRPGPAEGGKSRGRGRNRGLFVTNGVIVFTLA